MAIIGTLINTFIWSNWFLAAFRALLLKRAYGYFLLVSAFLMPFYSASFGVAGLQLSIYKIMPIFLLATFVISKEKINPKLIVIFTYFFTGTAISYYLALNGNLFEYIISLGRNEFSAYFSPIVQGCFFLMVLFQLWLLRKKADIDHIKIISFYVYGCMVLVVIGYVQIFSYIFGLPWFDFWFLNDAMGRSTAEGLAQHASDGGLYRMSSLAGEPRHFSAILAFSIMLQQYLKTTGRFLTCITGNRSYLTTMFLLSGMLFSMSSSGFLGLLVGGGLYLLFTDLKKATMLFISCATVIALFAEYSVVGNILWKLGSLDLILYAVKKDSFALLAMTHSWFNFLFGYGINLAEFYVPDYYLIQETPFGVDDRYLTNNPMESTIVPTSAILGILINGGIFGFLLLAFLAFGEIRRCRKKTKILMVSIMGMVSVVSTLIFSMSIFFFALIIAYENLIYRQNKR